MASGSESETNCPTSNGRKNPTKVEAAACIPYVFEKTSITNPNKKASMISEVLGILTGRSNMK